MRASVQARNAVKDAAEPYGTAMHALMEGFVEDATWLRQASAKLDAAMEALCAEETAELRAENTRLRDLLRRWRDCCSQACAGAEDCYAEALLELRGEAVSE